MSDLNRTVSRRYLTGRVLSAELRIAKFSDRDHLVVPVIALIGNTVVRPINGQGSEFVPITELSYAPEGWNGRPVLVDHPTDESGSANRPSTLENLAIGLIFNSKIEDERLKVEAWIDLSREERVGHLATRVIERCRAGEMVEVSVGCYVYTESKSGVAPTGDPFDYVWHDIVPDHLAMLPEGVEGACSVDAGCGAPRVNKRTESSTATNRKEVSPVKTDDVQKKLPSAGEMNALSLLAKTRILAEDVGPSDVELRNRLWELCRSEIPAFESVIEVFPDSSTFIYVVCPEGEFHYYRRSFTASDTAISLNDDIEEVELVTAWKPMGKSEEDAGTRTASVDPARTASARAAVAATTSPCKCGGHPATDPTPTTAEVADPSSPSSRGEHAAPTSEGGSSMNPKVKELAERLIANPRSPFTEKSRKALESMSEEDLNGLVADADKTEEKKEVDPATVTPAGGTPATTDPATPEAQALAALQGIPAEEIRSLVEMGRTYRAEQETRKAALISKLAAHPSIASEFKKGDLESKSLAEVETLCRIVGLEAVKSPTDFARAFPVAEGTPNKSEAPRPYDLALSKGKTPTGAGVADKTTN